MNRVCFHGLGHKGNLGALVVTGPHHGGEGGDGHNHGRLASGVS
jgi:hypothetical protein